MAIDNANQGRDAESGQVTEENARLRKQLAERDAELARLGKVLAEQAAKYAEVVRWLQERKAEQARFDTRISTLEMRAQRLLSRDAQASAVSPAASEARPRTEQARTQGAPRRHGQWPPLDDILRRLPSSKALYLLMFIMFLFQSVLTFFGERTQWVILKSGGTAAAVLAVAAATVTWRRKGRPNAE
jgi:hypothetical protein